jgi:hypothetical protein
MGPPPDDVVVVAAVDAVEEVPGGTVVVPVSGGEVADWEVEPGPEVMVTAGPSTETQT